LHQTQENRLAKVGWISYPRPRVGDGFDRADCCRYV